MKARIMEFLEDMVWTAKAYISQPIVPKKSYKWVVENGCSYSGESKNGKWRYYWFGDFKTGYEVKVKVSEIGKYPI